VQQSVRIGRDAVIAAGAIVLPGVTVGDFAIVREGSVVEHDAPFNVAAGMAAKVVQELPRDKVQVEVRGRSGGLP